MARTARSKQPPAPVPETDGPADTRDAILAVALAAFAELGFDGASTRAIAARAGVNQGLIPYYFGTKDKLWREAVDRAFALLHAGVAQALDEGPEAADFDIERMIRDYVRFVAEHPEFVRMMNDEGKRDGPRMRWLVDRHVKPLYERISILFERAQAEGRLPPGISPAVMHYLFAGASGMAFHQAPECRRVTGRDPDDPAFVAEQADAMVALFLGRNA